MRRRERGATTIEMTFVGIPLILTLVSIFEISRGMWIYSTLAYAVKDGVRYASVHGVNCVNNPPGVTNSCEIHISDVATTIQNAGVGLDPATTTLTFTPAVSGTPCTLGPASTSGTCLSLTSTVWPPTTGNENNVGQPIQINIVTPFHSALAMFWPGSTKPVTFTLVNLGASSTNNIQF
jgi:Flp pilus assembly protein TadG